MKQISNPYLYEMEYNPPPLTSTLDKFLQLNDSPVFEAMGRMIDEMPSGGKFQFDLIVAAIDLSLEYFKTLGL